MNSYSLLIVKVNPLNFICARIRVPHGVNQLGQLLTEHYDCHSQALALAELQNIDKLNSSLQLTVVGEETLELAAQTSVVSAVRTHGLKQITSIYFHDGNRWFLKAGNSDTVFEPLKMVLNPVVLHHYYQSPGLSYGF